MSSKYFAATALVTVTLISSCTSGPTSADVDLAGAPSSTAVAPVAPQAASSIVDTPTPNILSTTVARPTQAVATCPVGTHPDRPGPMNQARPTRDIPFLPAALDRQSGQVVAIATSGTWAFDVCTNTWARMSHSEYLTESLPIVVYDADSDLIVAIQRTVNAYDVDTDTWTNYSKVPTSSRCTYL